MAAQPIPKSAGMHSSPYGGRVHEKLAAGPGAGFWKGLGSAIMGAGKRLISPLTAKGPAPDPMGLPGFHKPNFWGITPQRQSYDLMAKASPGLAQFQTQPGRQWFSTSRTARALGAAGAAGTGIAGLTAASRYGSNAQKQIDEAAKPLPTFAQYRQPHPGPQPPAPPVSTEPPNGAPPEPPADTTTPPPTKPPAAPGWGEQLWGHVQEHPWAYGLGAAGLGLGGLAMLGGGGESRRARLRRRMLEEDEDEEKEASVKRAQELGIATPNVAVTGAPNVAPVEPVKSASPESSAPFGGGPISGQPAMVPNPYLPMPSWLEKRRSFEGGWKHANLDQSVGSPSWMDRIGQFGGDVMQHIQRHPLAYGLGGAGLGLGLGGLGAWGAGAFEPQPLSEKEKRQRIAALVEAEATGKEAMDKTAFDSATTRGIVMAARLGHRLGSWAFSKREPEKPKRHHKKKTMEKKAILPLVGAAIGHHLDDSGRGAALGFGSGMGAGMGILGGGLGGGMLGSAMGDPRATTLGTLLGGGLGALGGGLGGYHLTDRIMSDRDEDSKSDHEKKGATGMFKAADLPIVLGSMLGGMHAPHEKHKWEGIRRGALSGLGVDVGGGLGGALGGIGGALAGGALGGGPGAMAGLGIGGGLGLLGGGTLGFHEANRLMGPATWEKKHEKKEHKKEGMDKSAYGWAVGPAVGAPLGAMMAPSGHRWEGAGRGAYAGLGSGLFSGVGGLAGYGLGGLAGQALGGDTGRVLGQLAGSGLGSIGGGIGGYQLANAAMPRPSWEHHNERKEKHEEKAHEKEGTYPGCHKSRKVQAKQQARNTRRRMRKRGSFDLPWVLAGIIKSAAALKCGCGCTDCAACGTKQADKQKVRVINGPEVRTGKGQFAWRGRGAQSVRDDPMYDHFGISKAGDLGARAAALALSLTA